MSQNTHKNRAAKSGGKQNYHPDFHGAAIIDEHGIEHPITEEMVKKVIRQLKRDTVTKPH